MIYTYKDVQHVTFPVFLLPNDNWSFSDGLLFIDNQIVDDTNMKGSTLGVRRAQTPHEEVLPLRKSILNLTGIIKQKATAFIDTKGVPFIYEKTIWCKLKYYKIRKIERKEVASVLWVVGVNFPFLIPRPPYSGMTWAGIIHLKELPWFLYEYSEEKLKDTKRKV